VLLGFPRYPLFTFRLFYLLPFREINMTALLWCAFLFIVGSAFSQTKNPYGVYALTEADTVGHPRSAQLASNHCWTNTNISGVVLRTNWAKVEPAEGQYDWSYLDEGVALAGSNQKPVSITIVAGLNSPSWIYKVGAKPFHITGLGDMPQPWDPIFQQYWSAFVAAFAAKYNTNEWVSYVTMGGPGRTEELYMCNGPVDVQEFYRLGGLTAWETAAENICQFYGQQFTGTPFLYSTGQPVPPPKGAKALANVVNFCVATWGSRFGIKSDGLYYGYNLNSYGATEVLALSPTHPVGFQMNAAQNGDLGHLQKALNIAIGQKAHFVEVYATDCNDPSAATIISNANKALQP
jgi:hypothetical protein